MKPMFVISCPIDTYSGYGARSRDLVKAIVELDRYDVKILPQRWGNTPWNFIENNLKEWDFLKPLMLQGNQLPKKPEIWAQVTVPNEFQAIGKYNIGFTAGIETTVCAPHWIEGLNRMDMNVVSSEHAKKVFVNTSFEKRNENDQIIEKITLKKPVEVLFEGMNLTKFFPSKEKSSIDLSKVKESFAYLFVGHWMQGNLGEDRKNVGLLVQTFYETFKNQKSPPALILKTSSSGASYLDREHILKKLDHIKETVKADTLPNVYVLHGEFSDEEINDLYNHKKVKAMVSLTKGEGFGRPLLEFSLTKKPIITTNWSGHLDFLDSKFTTLIDGEVKQVHDSAAIKDMILLESSWFAPNVIEVQQHLQNMFTNYKSYEKGAMLQYHKSKNNFNFEHMVEVLGVILDQCPEFPSQIQLNLPQLKKPKSSSPQLQFPNLK